MNAIEKSILGRFSAGALKEYGQRLLGLYVFNYLFDEDDDDDEISVDLDVAVVLADDDWSFLDEKKRLVALTFDILLDTEVYIRAWPLPASAWHDPSTYDNPDGERGWAQCPVWSGDQPRFRPTHDRRL